LLNRTRLNCGLRFDESNDAEWQNLPLASIAGFIWNRRIFCIADSSFSQRGLVIGECGGATHHEFVKCLRTRIDPT